MKEIQGDIWDFHKQGHWVVITTNGTVRKDGAAVMGRGVAKQAAERFPKLRYELGQKIKHDGNKVFAWHDYKIFTFPVKHDWFEMADPQLIEKSCRSLAMDDFYVGNIFVYLVRPGVGNGKLDWKDVKPILEKYLDDRFIVVEKEGYLQWLRKEFEKRDG